MTLLDPTRFPRFELLHGPTPIERLARLEARLGARVRLSVKRDDLTPVGGGGNKLRKLEYLLGRGLADGVDTVLTVGGVQSNHARSTAAAAARAGLACELWLSRQVPRTGEDYERSGNVLLDGIFGAKTQFLAADQDPLAHAQARAEHLRGEGRRVLLVPTGGSTALGCLGYVQCTSEIVEQSAALGVAFDRICVANGSAGTHAGLAAGHAALGLDATRVRSYTVLADTATAVARTTALARETLALLGSPASMLDVDVDGTQRGDAYGVPTEAMVHAVRLLAETEGLLLDPVYSGKAFAGVIADIRAGRFDGQHVLFVMTGGTPSLYAYRSVFEA